MKRMLIVALLLVGYAHSALAADDDVFHLRHPAAGCHKQAALDRLGKRDLTSARAALYGCRRVHPMRARLR